MQKWKNKAKIINKEEYSLFRKEGQVFQMPVGPRGDQVSVSYTRSFKGNHDYNIVTCMSVTLDGVLDNFILNSLTTLTYNS
jgi:hypothetical protein